jgi:hypothetical protein
MRHANYMRENYSKPDNYDGYAVTRETKTTESTNSILGHDVSAMWNGQAPRVIRRGRK